jgi:hypothetical protein
VAETGPRPWADRTFLREVQYQTDVNLAARQSIYAYQRPPVNLMSRTLDLAGPIGREVVADIGCGNGLYRPNWPGAGTQGPSSARTCRRACCARPGSGPRTPGRPAPPCSWPTRPRCRSATRRRT